MDWFYRMGGQVFKPGAGRGMNYLNSRAQKYLGEALPGRLNRFFKSGPARLSLLLIRPLWYLTGVPVKGPDGGRAFYRQFQPIAVHHRLHGRIHHHHADGAAFLYQDPGRVKLRFSGARAFKQTLLLFSRFVHPDIGTGSGGPCRAGLPYGACFPDIALKHSGHTAP